MDRDQLDRAPDRFIQTDRPVFDPQFNAAGVTPKTQHHYVIAALLVDGCAREAGTENLFGKIIGRCLGIRMARPVLFLSEETADRTSEAF